MCADTPERQMQLGARNGEQSRGNAVGDVGGRPCIPCCRQVRVELCVLVGVEVQLTLPTRPDWVDGDEPCAS